jgi:hypothetical protein
MKARESEGRIKAMTSGNGRQPDPAEQKAARAETNFRRATWATHQRRKPC